MLDKELLDLYTDYLIACLGKVTATGLSDILDNQISHDKITRFLHKDDYDPKLYWQQIKPIVRAVEHPEGILIIDDTIERKPYTDENAILCYHFDHTQGRCVKGINLINFLYVAPLEDGEMVSLPVAYECVSKTQTYVNKQGKKRRKSNITKNERVQERLRILIHHNQVAVKYILCDHWFASKDNIRFVKNVLKKDILCPIKHNRLLALSLADKQAGNFVHVCDVDMEAEQTCKVFIKGLAFPVMLTKQVFTNKDGSVGIQYLISTDVTLDYLQITTTYQKRWCVEVFHQSLKQNVGLEKSPTQTVRTQSNHIFACMLAYVKLERLKMQTHLNHFALKAKLYLKAMQTAWVEYKTLQAAQTVDPLAI